MDNKVLAEMIREKYYEEKMTAEYKTTTKQSRKTRRQISKMFFKR